MGQASVLSDGVSEAGLPFEQVRSLFSHFDDVEFVPVADLRHVEWSHLPRDGRCNLLVSNHHARYAQRAPAGCIDLHLAIWNPFHALDVAAPALVTWGYADGAMAALHAWLEDGARARPVPGGAVHP
jgi:beta-N-acetylhexosaminidase